MAKKHGHEKKHAHCEHCLHVCDHCEIAYCCDCNKEWGGYHAPYYLHPTITTPFWTGTTASDVTNVDIAIIDGDRGVGPDCVHTHTTN